MSNTTPDTIQDQPPHESLQDFVVPHPGSPQMPQWGSGELPKAPILSWRSLPLLLGPGLVMGAAAVGGGEWLTGPLLSAQYGGALLWLATLSVLGQVIYNIEICRYTLYTGEPIFTGKFRTLPGPLFWLGLYLVLDIGSFLPYLASNAAIPLAAMWLGDRLPDPNNAADQILQTRLSMGILLAAMAPLAFGGKVYDSLKYLMSAKLIVVLGFLLFLAIGYSTWETWREIIVGFVSFGTLPFKGEAEGTSQLINVPLAWWNGTELPVLELSMLGVATSMAAIAGNGGLTNAPISNYARDQGWGMGKLVGAIPSIVGGQSITLSHVGKVFPVNEESLKRWKGWMSVLNRDQFFVWLPACFMGIALPSMLSIQFLERGVSVDDKWRAAALTADGVAAAVGGSWTTLFWNLTLFCGFLVLITSCITTMDGALRRWVDVAWTSSPLVRKMNVAWIGRFYFGALCLYGGIGLVLLNLAQPQSLLLYTTTFYNFALGISCFHVIVINHTLLPREIRPGWGKTALLFLAGLFYTVIAVIATLLAFNVIG
ncbi:Nramp family divalent metal transporter [Planctomicrobium sp. SH668]|uniref:Nramp family divalent metal transporter n=1 Tax=Planctomicrobium sp. SH668 TaxID=3448126 RepID=UPI003F5BBA48